MERYPHIHVYSSSICNGQKVETSHVSICGWVSKPKLTCTGIKWDVIKP